MFQKIGVFGKYQGIACWDTIDRLIQHLISHEKIVFLDQDSCNDFPHQRYDITMLPRTELLSEIELAIVVGGDGTFLDVARSVIEEQIPIIGINLGRLGFLTDISPNNMNSILDEMLDGVYDCEERNMLEVHISLDGETQFHQFAFNDVVIHKTDSPRMIEFETFVDGRFLNSQRSDGLIISTPTGSTAYALSAGGPLLDPRLSVMSLVSINPHTMSTRPFVVPGESVIEIRPHDNCNGLAHIICDGLATHNIGSQHLTTIRCHKKRIRMMHPKGHDHFKLLRAKLHWGDKLS